MATANPSIPPVVSAAWLADHPEAVVADVRFFLDGSDPRQAYLSGHLPGAVFIDLHQTLAGPGTPETGRHPLPMPDAFAAGMEAAGISDGSLVVAYDDAGGAQAGRLVWMLRTLGHDAALLDGGLQAWDGPVDTAMVTPEPGSFTPQPWPINDLATIDDASLGELVIDSRAPERYRGDVEPMDAVAGHVPGARNRFYADNLGADKRFRDSEALRADFEGLGISDASRVIVYCGSGVTACHNLLALEHAGLGRGRLFVGSWSQYAASGRPVATGDEPGQRVTVDNDGTMH